MNVFEYRSVIQAPVAAVFSWHEQPEALTDLLPSTRWVRIDHRVDGIRNGEVTLSVGIGMLRLRWVAKHDGFVPGRQFCDEQVTGPFAHWRHRHRFIPIARELTVYEDRVEYALPGGRLINRCLEPLLRRLLTRAFKDRHAVVRNAVSRPQPRGSRAATLVTLLHCLLLLTVATRAAAPDTSGTATLQGHVVTASGQRLGDAAVCATGTSQCAVTAADGSFTRSDRDR